MTTEVPPLAGKGIIPVGRTAIDSYRFVFINLDRFLALAWAPMAVNVATHAVILAVMGAGAEAMEFSPARFVETTLISLPSYAMYVLFAVRWHRLYLLEERHGVFTEVFAARNWRFLGYFLLLSLAPGVPKLIFGPSGWPIVMVLYFVFLRFSLVLPSAAVDRPLGFGEAWRKMRGYLVPYFAIFILIAIPIIIVAVILAAVVFSGMGAGGSEVAFERALVQRSLVHSGVTAIFTFFFTAAGITVLSKLYRHIVGGETGEGGAAAGP